MTPEEIKEEKQKIFLEALSSGLSVTAAVQAATPLSKMTVYRWRKSDPAFEAAWAEALEEGTDKLEDEAHRRAFEGVERPVYQGGVQVGSYREYSDRLMEFLLKGRRPYKYRERTAIEHSVGAPMEKRESFVDEILQKIESIVRGGHPPRLEHEPHRPSSTSHGNHPTTNGRERES
jgi:hypothetical protein